MAISYRHKHFAAALVVLWLLGAMAWMSRYLQSPSRPFQEDVQVVFEGYEFRAGAQQGYAKVTLRNNTDRSISFPVLRDGESRVAAVISSARKGTDWTASAWDETAKDEVFVQLEAESGGCVRLLIPLKIGADPKRVALLCNGIPESAMMRWKRALASALEGIGFRHSLQILPVDFEREVWCSQELCLPDGKGR